MSETVSAPNASASLSIDRRFLATSAALAAGWGALPRERADISPPLSVFDRGSCPQAWCSWRPTAFAGWSRACQLA
ncbi:hypothetical protein, partial [Bradyrhizobium sp. SZCCHNRI3052]|uniref:hypothetical protein n=1 Tax=Bradyrhizobium sp. SZCCHNRI3052 TaxID=3057295 RepID=UPI002916A1D8